jgi:hypothetical protein
MGGGGGGGSGGFGAAGGIGGTGGGGNSFDFPGPSVALSGSTGGWGGNGSSCNSITGAGGGEGGGNRFLFGCCAIACTDIRHTVSIIIIFFIIKFSLRCPYMSIPQKKPRQKN